MIWFLHNLIGAFYEIKHPNGCIFIFLIFKKKFKEKKKKVVSSTLMDNHPPID